MQLSAQDRIGFVLLIAETDTVLAEEIASHALRAKSEVAEDASKAAGDEPTNGAQEQEEKEFEKDPEVAGIVSEGEIEAKPGSGDGDALERLRTLPDENVTGSVPHEGLSTPGRCERCDAAIPSESRHGSQRRFCSSRCRKAAWRKRGASKEAPVDGDGYGERGHD